MEACRGLCGTRETGRRPDIYFDLRWLILFLCFYLCCLYSCSAILKVVYLFVKINLKIVVINVLFFNFFFSFPSRYIASQKFHELEKQVSSCKPFFWPWKPRQDKKWRELCAAMKTRQQAQWSQGKKTCRQHFGVNHLGDSSGNVQLFWVAYFGP